MPIRLRLAIFIALILAAGLLIFSSVIYLIADQTLHAQANQSIAQRAERIDALLGTSRHNHGAGMNRHLLARLPKVFASPGESVLLLDATGTVIAASNGLDLPSPACAAQCSPVVAGNHIPVAPYAHIIGGTFRGRSVDHAQFRVYILRRTGAGPVRYILVGHSVQSINDMLTILATVLLGGSMVCLILVGATAWFLARRALAPVADLTRTAARVAQAGDFAARMPAPARPDEVGQMAITFNAMLSRLEDLHASQRRFVSDASHELRAPLTAIRGNAELLLLDPHASEEDQTSALQDIAGEAERLARLVYGLLSLARGDAGQAPPRQPVALHETLAAACKWATERPNAPRVVLGRFEPAMTHANPDRLAQVLLILLDNATKYTPECGAVTCSLSVRGQWAVLSVQDTGIGIHPDDLPHIFERFFRATAVRAAAPAPPGSEGGATLSPGVHGTGLGLAIARQIVEETGGTITAHSRLGQGSTFTVHLPLQTATGPEAPSDQRRGGVFEAGQRTTILSGTGATPRST
jgi:signal transduction histidine kinase